MQAPEIARTLKEQGHELGTQVVNSDGKMCWLVDGMYMFHEDAADLARGRATKDEIAKRNAGKNIPRLLSLEFNADFRHYQAGLAYQEHVLSWKSPTWRAPRIRGAKIAGT